MSSQQIKSVIGFDLGDSQTVLSIIDPNDESAAPKNIECALGKNGLILTIVGYKNDEVLIGQAAAICKELNHEGLYVGFKEVPKLGVQQYKDLTKDFVNHLFSHLINENIINLDECKIIVGHPSRWGHSEQGETITIFSDILKETIIGKSFEPVSESRAAMVEAIEADEQKNKERNRLQEGWVLVIDAGSSTIDFTAVNLKEKACTIDYGEEIGARLIDRAILDLSMDDNGENKDVISDFFNHRPEQKAKLELFCREAKEKYFSCESSIDVPHGLFIKGKRVYHDVILDKERMDYIINQLPLVKIDGEQLSYSEALKKSLCAVKKMLHSIKIDDISAILLTGGACNMGFIRDVCVEVFPNLRNDILRSPNPSNTIAHGLARWGRIQHRTENFKSEVKSLTKTTIPTAVRGHLEWFYIKLADAVSEAIIKIIKNKFDSWKAGYILTINDMNRSIDKSIKSRLDKDFSKVAEDIYSEFIKKVNDEIDGKLKELENKYNIPRGELQNKLELNSRMNNRLVSTIKNNQLAK